MQGVDADAAPVRDDTEEVALVRAVQHDPEDDKDEVSQSGCDSAFLDTSRPTGTLPGCGSIY